MHQHVKTPHMHTETHTHMCAHKMCPLHSAQIGAKMRGPLNSIQETEVMNSVCGATEPGA